MSRTVSSNLNFATAAANAAGDNSIGSLPEWKLDDLYPGMDSALFKTDLTRALPLCCSFAERWRGKLADIAGSPEASEKLCAAVREYEEIEELLGRIMSYAGLLHAGDTTDTARTKFYGDAQDKVTTASSEMLFFTLELNRIDDGLSLIHI